MRARIGSSIVITLAIAVAGLGASVAPASAAASTLGSVTKVPPSCTLLSLSLIKKYLGGRPTGPTYVKGVCVYGTLDLQYGSATYPAMVKLTGTHHASAVKGIGVDAWGFTEDEEDYVDLWYGGVSATMWTRSASPAQLHDLAKLFANLLWDR
jgi:hypothetical protein